MSSLKDCGLKSPSPIKQYSERGILWNDWVIRAFIREQSIESMVDSGRLGGVETVGGAWLEELGHCKCAHGNHILSLDSFPHKPSPFLFLACHELEAFLLQALPPQYSSSSHAQRNAVGGQWTEPLKCEPWIDFYSSPLFSLGILVTAIKS